MSVIDFPLSKAKKVIVPVKKNVKKHTRSFEGTIVEVREYTRLEGFDHEVLFPQLPEWRFVFFNSEPVKLGLTVRVLSSFEEKTLFPINEHFVVDIEHPHREKILHLGFGRRIYMYYQATPKKSRNS